jgi:hypothetical protein
MDKLFNFLQKDLKSAAFSFANITACVAYKVETLRLTSDFDMHQVQLQFSTLDRDLYIWIPLEVILRTASFACLRTLKIIMMANPRLGSIALEQLNSAWSTMHKSKAQVPTFQLPGKGGR